MQRRVAQIGETARRIILLAAVAGRRFDFELLRQMPGHDERALLQVMKELIAAQLVSEEAAGRFVFRHALTQHAIYSQSLALERKGLHRAIGETMERLYADAIDTYVSDLAYHFCAAEVWDKALTYSQRAGEKAQQMYAPHAAVEHFSHALEAARRLAREVGSLNFLRNATASLALICLAQNDLPRAEEVLTLLLGEGDPWTALDEAAKGQQPLTMSQRQLWYARPSWPPRKMMRRWRCI